MAWRDKAAKMAKLLWEKVEKKRRDTWLAQERKLRLADLEARFYKVGKVRLPFPSLYALNWLEINIAPLDDIDLNNHRHLGAVIFILENQHAVDELAKMFPEDIKHAIDRQLSEIGSEQHFEYLLCVQEMLEMIKKKYLKETQAVLENYLRILKENLNSSPDGP